MRPENVDSMAYLSIQKEIKSFIEILESLYRAMGFSVNIRHNSSAEEYEQLLVTAKLVDKGSESLKHRMVLEYLINMHDTILRRARKSFKELDEIEASNRSNAVTPPIEETEEVRTPRGGWRQVSGNTYTVYGINGLANITSTSNGQQTPILEEGAMPNAIQPFALVETITSEQDRP